MCVPEYEQNPPQELGALEVPSPQLSEELVTDAPVAGLGLQLLPVSLTVNGAWPLVGERASVQLGAGAVCAKADAVMSRQETTMASNIARRRVLKERINAPDGCGVHYESRAEGERCSGQQLE